MGANVYVERSSNQLPIDVSDWLALLGMDAQLRKRSEPYLIKNPVTGAAIELPVGEADSEMQIDGQWEPFLALRRGKLSTRYQVEMEQPTNQRRKKIVEIANMLQAQIFSEESDDPLQW